MSNKLPDGKEVASVLKIYERGDPLTDENLRLLIAGLQFIFDFLRADEMRRLAYEYRSTLDELHRMQELRKE